MKLGLSYTLAIFALVAIAPLDAQVYSVAVTIPFEFSAANTTLPAGQYRVDLDSGGQIVTLRNYDAGITTHFLASSNSRLGRATDPSMLVFHRYENRYFLASIWDAARVSGHQLAPGREERELARTASTRRSEFQVLLARR